MTRTTRFNLWLAVVLLAIGGGWWWLLLDNRTDGAQPQPLHIGELRRLAKALPGPHPGSMAWQTVARRNVSGTVIATGIGLKVRTLSVNVYRLEVPGRPPIAINAGMTAAQAKAFGFSDYDPAAQRHVDRLLSRAGLILATNESAEHLGGLSALAMRPGGAGIMNHVVLRPQQVLRAPRQHLDWPAALRPAPADTALHAVAPGVVTIPAPGHSQGSQMIFVTLADGREVLFASDVSPLAVNWRELRARSRLLGGWHNHQDRRSVYSWLMTIRQLKAEAPGLIIVPGHDAEWLEGMTRAGQFRAGFAD
ncbi:MAG: hypothetical protein KGN34_11905 [Sphingomonadales bacterium]|nr:hypothetical protein [Sphingomonadales bacterium]